MAKKKTIKKKKTEDIGNTISKKEQIQRENNILRNFLLGIVFLVAIIVGFMIFTNSVKTLTYEGVDFEVVKFCDSKPCLITYRTSLPVKIEDDGAFFIIPSQKDNDYNFYLRKDPRELEVQFQGNLQISENLVLNSTADFNCNGDGIIAVRNLVTLYEVIGANVLRDETANCSSEGEYMFINLKEGNQTEVKNLGPACYEIIINNCEILEGTERFMVETFIELNKLIQESL